LKEKNLVRKKQGRNSSGLKDKNIINCLVSKLIRQAIAFTS
jgi:hypothetical protein